MSADASATASPRSAIITGGASGIGRALALELARRGTVVWIADRQRKLAEQVAAEITESGGTAAAIDLDVRDAAQFDAVVQHVAARSGRLDYLFNNAGIAITGEASEHTAADWTNIVDVNLRGVANGIQAAYPLMIGQGFGHIINSASMAGLIPMPMQIGYSATKFAVVALSRVLRSEAKVHGVNVTVLCPGAVRTPILYGGEYGRFTSSLDKAVLEPTVERLRPMDPTRLARRVLAGVDRNRAVIVEPAWCRALWYLARMSPALADRVSGLMLKQVRRDVAARDRAASPL